MKTIKIVILAVLSFGSLRASTIEGTLFRLGADSLVLKGVRVLRHAPHQKNENPLTISYVDYRGTIEGVEFFAREGVDVNMLDPSTPSAKVLRLAERNSGNYHIYDVICSEDGFIVCGVLIEPKLPSARYPDTRGAGIYFAVRGNDPRKMATALSLYLGEVRLGLSGSIFEHFCGNEGAAGFKEMLDVLKAQK